MTTSERIKKFLANHLDVGEVYDTSNIVDDLCADSLDVMEIIMWVEEEFGIELRDDEIMDDDGTMRVRTVADLVALVERKM